MGGGGGPEAEFYGGPAPRGWRTVPGGLSRSPWPRSCAGACCCVRRRGRGAKERKAPEPILVREHGRNFPAAAVFEPGRAGLVAASGAAATGRRKGRPRSPFLRGDTAGTFPRRRFLSRRGRACCCVRYRGRGAEERRAWGPFLCGDTAGTSQRRRFLSRQGVHPMPEMAIFASASDAASLRRAELR